MSLCRKRPFPRVGRTLPPAAVPFTPTEIMRGLGGCLWSRRELARFEAEIIDFFRVRHCFSVSSGKTALHLLLQALQQLRPGRDQVLIPAYTCFSVPSAIVRAGLKVTVCDNDSRTLDFDFSRLESLLDKAGMADRLLCVVPTHLFGLPADVGRLQTLLRAKGLADVPVIEDAAQAMGAADRERIPLGTRGDAGFFSLGRGKALSLGEGGIIITGRDDLARALAPLVAGLGKYSVPELGRIVAMTVALTFLIRPAWFWLPKALPWLKLGETIFDPGFVDRRLSGFQAGLARNWPSKLKRLQSTRARQAASWGAVLPPDVRHYHRSGGGNPIRFPVRVADPKVHGEILSQSDRHGLGVMPGYPAPVGEIPALRGKIQGDLPVPNAAALAENLLTLPVHRFITVRDRQRIATLFSRRRTGVSKIFSPSGQEEICKWP